MTDLERESEQTIPVAVIAGPTASGKSALAMQMAEKLGGEIVSCDSMQIYRGMDIGTAKPTAEDRLHVPHHMLDIADPYDPQPYSCAAYVQDASRIVEEIAARGRIPVICGGTGLYLDGLLTGNRYAEAVRLPGFAERMEERDNLSLWEQLRQNDPEAAAAIHPNNRRRTLRALEILEATGMTKTAWDRASRRGLNPRYHLFAVGLDYPDRAALIERINQRIDRMIQLGLVEEVARLHDLPRGSSAAQAIGYKEMFAWLDGKCSQEEALEQVRNATRRYAKRQLTWFRSKSYLRWYFVEPQAGENGNFQKLFEEIVNDAKNVLTKR